jgi:hypothetical protein
MKSAISSFTTAHEDEGSAQSSEQFGLSMTMGWIAGLRSLAKYRDFNVLYEVKVKEDIPKGQRDIGDINLLMNFGEEVTLQDILRHLATYYYQKAQRG